jgi:hypothetical protein
MNNNFEVNVSSELLNPEVYALPGNFGGVSNQVKWRPNAQNNGIHNLGIIPSSSITTASTPAHSQSSLHTPSLTAIAEVTAACHISSAAAAQQQQHAVAVVPARLH